jgi:hypothetical protein
MRGNETKKDAMVSEKVNIYYYILIYNMEYILIYNKNTI